MRRRRRVKPSGGVQMFSFLDAMICTMGALLVLLHAFARHGEIEISQTQSNVSEEELQAQRDELQWKIDQLKASRDKTEAQLAAERLKLSHVEDHERRLKQQLERLKIAAQEYERLDSAEDRQTQAAQAELEAAQAEVRDAKLALDEARRKAQEVEPTYSVVPYEGAHSTRRRPVYIECRANSIVIQPEGIELQPDDFAGFLGPGNALASALRGAREYFAAQGGSKEAAEPYPLLLVRPDGIEAYYAARSALSSWGSDFGYELVGGDWKLKFHEADPRLAELTRQIVFEARQRQLEYFASAPPAARNRKRPTYHARSHGGFVQERGSGMGGSGGGGRGGADSLGSQWARSRPSGAGPDGAGGSDPYGGGGTSGSGLGPGGTGTGGSGNNRGGSDDGSLLGSGHGQQPGSEMGSGGQGPQWSSRGAGGGTDRYGQVTGGAPGEGEVSPENSPYGTGVYDQTGGGGSRYSGARGVGNARGGGSRPGSASDAPGEHEDEVAGEGGGQSADRVASTPGGSGRTGQPGTSGSSGSPSGSSTGQTSGASGQSSNAQGNQVSMGSGSSQSSGDASSSSGASSPSPQSPQSKKVKSMAQSRGRNWGLQNSDIHAVGATRPVLIECHDDRLLILSENRSDPPKEIKLKANTQASMDELVSNVWQHTQGWGMAGKGMYWKPELVMEVKPGAADRYAEIKGLLADSGMEVRERQRPAAKPAQRNATRR